MNELLVTFREALEASLVLGIMHTYAYHKKDPSAVTWIWVGTLSALVVSILAGMGLHYVLGANPIWEGVFLLVASFLLIHMVVWMAKHSRAFQQKLITHMESSWGPWLGALAFFAVAREGIETVIFLRAVWSIQSHVSWISGLLGIGLAVALGYGIFYQGRKIPLKRFFVLSSVVLLAMGAGMCAYGVHELLESAEKAGFAWAEKLLHARAWNVFPPKEPGTVSSFWYTCPSKCYFFLHDKGWLGSILKVLIGWRAKMAWAELLTAITASIVGFTLWYKNLSQTPK
ncbi:MAG: FTR1 family iron permease [Bacteroidia bacterium]